MRRQEVKDLAAPRAPRLQILFNILFFNIKFCCKAGCFNIFFKIDYFISSLLLSSLELIDL